MMGWKWKYGKQIANLIKSLQQGSVLNWDFDIKYISCMNVLGGTGTHRFQSSQQNWQYKIISETAINYPAM